MYKYVGTRISRKYFLDSHIYKTFVRHVSILSYILSSISAINKGYEGPFLVDFLEVPEMPNSIAIHPE